MSLSDQQSPWLFLRGLEPVSFCDWPGKISAVLFLGGCNLRCPTCHNRQLAFHPETLPLLPKNDVMRLLATRRGWIDGLVISGGEPTTVPFLEDLLAELAGQGLPVKLDTNGLAPERIERLLAANLVECLAVDVKGPWTKYPLLTGGACSPERARDSLQAVFALAENHPEHFLFRLTEVPALSSGDIEEVEACLPDGFHLTRQEYRPVSGGQETGCPQAVQQ
jgi:pyruvate formate lyase activating enzyme